MIPGCVSQERLTRQELSWLLAQEARGAAKALREGVQQLAHPAPPEVSISEAEAPAVETNLDALDDAISRLSELQMGQTSKARRGRIDLASLLCEVVPNARIAMETGSGTEVFGEESELRRMLHLLVSRTNSSPADAEPTRTDIDIKRDGDWIRVSVELGPDSSATAELERRFLSRMATRHGGRLELERGMETLILPADRATEEVAELRKELEQAQQLGEAYARELAAVFATADGAEPKTSTLPPPPGSERLELLVTAAQALVRQLRTWLEGARSDVSRASEELGAETEIATQLTWRISSFQELFAELERLAGHATREAPAQVDLAAELKEIVQSAESRAARHGVSIELDTPDTLEVSTLLETFTLAARGLLDQAIAATPRDGRVKVRLTGNANAYALAVEDGGPVVANANRRDLLRGRADPSALGRPEGLGLVVADAAASVLGGAISIGESSTGRAEVLLSV